MCKCSSPTFFLVKTTPLNYAQSVHRPLFFKERHQCTTRLADLLYSPLLLNARHYTFSQLIVQSDIVNAGHCTTRLANLLYSPRIDKCAPLHYTFSQPIGQSEIVNTRQSTTRLTNLLHSPILLMRATALHVKLTYCTVRYCQCVPLHYTFSQPIVQSAIVKVRHCTTPTVNVFYTSLSAS